MTQVSERNSNKNLASKIIYSTVLLVSITFFFGYQKATALGPSLKTIKKVMIDAGHGGHDPGNLCTKRYKKTEKDLALDVALQVGEKIEATYPDVEVLYTRTEDEFLELRERTALANEAEVDLFISVHCDAADSKNAKGCSSFVIGPAKTEANLKLAQRENASMLKERDYEKNYSGFDPYSPESYIEMSLRQNSHVVQSLSFAQHVQDYMREQVKRVDRGVRQAPYWVISYTTMPSVLIEMGFTTNPDEEDFIRSKDGQDKIAGAILKAFGEYKSEVEQVNVSDMETLEAIRNSSVEEEQIIETENPIKDISSAVFDDVEDEKMVVFKVQIATSSQNIDTSPANFKGLLGVEMYKSGSLYKYTVGEESSFKKAKSKLKEIKEDQYPSAFIVAFKGEQRIDLQEALK